MPLYRVVIQELPEPRNAEEPGLVGRAVRSLDVEVDAESPEEAVEKGWDEWDTKHPEGDQRQVDTGSSIPSSSRNEQELLVRAER